jgi:formiminotetrahydrofolate cyclodeaminase
MSTSTIEIKDILQKWADAKAEIAELEKNIEKYKRVVNRIMDQKGNNTITSSKFTLRRKEMSRSTMSKKNVPTEIWNKYSRPCTYKAYYISKIK